MKLKQCRIVRGRKEQLSWIPEEFAIKGKYIKLKTTNGLWEDGWLVRSVGDRTIDKEDVVGKDII